MDELTETSGGLTRRQFITAASGLAVASTVLGLGAQPVSALSINPRSSWATDRPPRGPLQFEDVKFLLVHHSASRNGHTTADAPGILRSFYDYHTGPEKGWNDIAYNFLIDADGGIWEGRSGSLDGPVAGDATGGNQGFTQLVCLIGDYNVAQPSNASLSSLVSLLAWLADRYEVATSPVSTVSFTSRGSNKWPSGASVTTLTLAGHRTMSNTTCPGENLNACVVGDLMADVTAARGGETVPSTTPATTTTSSSSTTSSSTTSSSTTSTKPTPVTSTSTSTTTTTEPPTTTIGVASTRVSDAVAIESISTTTQAVSASQAPATVTASPSTLAPGAAEPASGGSVIPVVASGLVVIASGALAWRYRRMSDK